MDKEKFLEFLEFHKKQIEKEKLSQNITVITENGVFKVNTKNISK